MYVLNEKRCCWMRKYLLNGVGNFSDPQW